LHQIRLLNNHAKLALVGVLALFLWLNLDYSIQPYTEHIQDGWRGGVRYGLPFVCWDAAQDATAFRLPNGQMDLRFADVGGVVWLGLLGNLSALAAVLLATAWSFERIRRVMIRNVPVGTLAGKRFHRGSYAMALCVAATVLWMNAQFNIEQVQQGRRIDYKQSMGWPLASFTATDPAKWEFVRASAKGQTMIEHLRENPGANYRLGHWHPQNVSMNYIIGTMLTLFSLLLCNSVLQHARAQNAALQGEASRS
jgi:hypothetical protein